MLWYGLTGNLGAGKSTVAGLFCKQGVPVLEADRLGHELLAGGRLAEQVVERFPECRRPGAGLDRQKLAERVFLREEDRRWLESLLHPAIWALAQARVRELGPAPLCLLEGAVLLESPLEDFRRLAGLVLVIAPWEKRQERVLTRAGGREAVLTRQRFQLPQAEKLLRADLVIDNGGELADTRRQVKAAAKLLLREVGGGS